MSIAALVLFAVYLLVAFLVRTLLQLRRTGDSGWRGVTGEPGSSEWWAGVLFVVALVAGLLGPVADLLGLDPINPLSAPVAQGAGGVIAVGGVLATFWTQMAMGASWRIGVDDTERTALVTTGPFALVRNPIFSAMALTGTGLTLIVPNAVAVTGLVLLVLALQLQVRVVEEPYLRATHGAAYLRYAATTGRFLPGVGRWRDQNETPGVRV